MIYNGTSTIQFMHQRGEHAGANAADRHPTLGNQQQLTAMAFNNDCTVEFYNVWLTFTASGVTHNGFSNVRVFGGRYELNNTTAGAAYIYVFLIWNGRLLLQPTNLISKAGSRDLWIGHTVTQGAAYANGTLIYCRAGLVDTRYAVGQAVPRITFVNDISGWNGSGLFYIGNEFQWYNDDGPSGLWNALCDYTFTFNGTVAQRWFTANGGVLATATSVTGGLGNINSGR